jgi:hypothetical protein
MRHALRICPEPPTATRTAAAGTVRGVRRRCHHRPTQPRGVHAGRTPTAPRVREAGSILIWCPLTGQNARLPDTTADIPPQRCRCR